jgi:hypothetical protein
MALTFIVEDGTGLADATSYVSVSDATDILSLNPISNAAWAALTPTEQETYLMWASRYLDQHVDWYGDKTVEDSALRWPREYVYDIDGILIADDVIPEQLKRATAQLAIFLISSQEAQTGGQSSILPEGIKRVKADVVEVEFSDGSSTDSRTGSGLLPVNMRYLIQGIGTVMTGRQRMAKVVR